MKQLVSPPVPNDTFGALLRAGRNRAWLSQEQLAARAGLSERTVASVSPEWRMTREWSCCR